MIKKSKHLVFKFLILFLACGNIQVFAEDNPSGKMKVTVKTESQLATTIDTFYSISKFGDNGLAVFEKGTLVNGNVTRSFLYGLINTKGEIIVEPIYLVIRTINDHYYHVEADTGSGLLSMIDGTVVLEPKFKWFPSLNSDRFVVLQGYIDNSLSIMKKIVHGELKDPIVPGYVPFSKLSHFSQERIASNVNLIHAIEMPCVLNDPANPCHTYTWLVDDLGNKIMSISDNQKYYWFYSTPLAVIGKDIYIRSARETYGLGIIELKWTSSGYTVNPLFEGIGTFPFIWIDKETKTIHFQGSPDPTILNRSYNLETKILSIDEQQYDLFEYDYTIKSKGKYSFLENNMTGKIIADNYDYIVPVTHNVYELEKWTTFKSLDGKGEDTPYILKGYFFGDSGRIIKPQFLDVYPCPENLIYTLVAIKSGSYYNANSYPQWKWGLINQEYSYILQPIYDYVSPLNREGISVFGNNFDSTRLRGLFSVDKGIILPMQYTDFSPTSSGLDQISQEQLFGFEAQKAVLLFDEYGMVKVEKADPSGLSTNSHFGLANKNGLVIEPIYDVVKLSNDFYQLGIKETGSETYEWTLINPKNIEERVTLTVKGKLPYSIQKYNDYYLVSYAFGYATNKTLYGLLDSQGTVLIEPIYDSIEFDGSVWYLQKQADDLLSSIALVLDQSFNEIINQRKTFSRIGNFVNGYSPAISSNTTSKISSLTLLSSESSNYRVSIINALGQSVSTLSSDFQDLYFINSENDEIKAIIKKDGIYYYGSVVIGIDKSSENLISIIITVLVIIILLSLALIGLFKIIRKLDFKLIFNRIKYILLD